MLRTHIKWHDDTGADLLRPLLSSRVRLHVGDDLPDAVDVLVAGRPTDEALDALVEGGALVIPFAGLPKVTADLLERRMDVRIYNLHHNAAAVAEHAIGLLLAAARLVVPADRALRAGDWRIRYRNDDGIPIEGSTITILGFGAIGRRVARALDALGAHVVGIRRSDAPDPGWDCRPLRKLGEALETSTALIVCCPSTDETRGCIGPSQLRLLGESGVVVNVGRADIIDEAALYEALHDGMIHSAAIDVWYQYPSSAEARERTLPAEHPFHELDNIVMSPHRAGHHRAIEILRREHLAELLNTLAEGGEPENRVRRKLGY